MKEPSYQSEWNRHVQRPKYLILEETVDLENREKYWIKYYRELNYRLVNTTDGGEGVEGYRFSEEQRQMISEKTKQAMKNLPDSLKEKMWKHRTGKPACNRTKIQDQFGNNYNSLSDAAAKLKCSVALISLQLSNKVKTAKGYIFRKII